MYGRAFLKWAGDALKASRVNDSRTLDYEPRAVEREYMHSVRQGRRMGTREDEDDDFDLLWVEVFSLALHELISASDAAWGGILETICNVSRGMIDGKS